MEPKTSKKILIDSLISDININRDALFCLFDNVLPKASDILDLKSVKTIDIEYLTHVLEPNDDDWDNREYVSRYLPSIYTVKKSDINLVIHSSSEVWAVFERGQLPTSFGLKPTFKDVAKALRANDLTKLPKVKIKATEDNTLLYAYECISTLNLTIEKLKEKFDVKVNYLIKDATPEIFQAFTRSLYDYYTESIAPYKDIVTGLPISIVIADKPEDKYLIFTIGKELDRNRFPLCNSFYGLQISYYDSGTLVKTACFSTGNLDDLTDGSNREQCVKTSKAFQEAVQKLDQKLTQTLSDPFHIIPSFKDQNVKSKSKKS